MRNEYVHRVIDIFVERFKYMVTEIDYEKWFQIYRNDFIHQNINNCV